MGEGYDRVDGHMKCSECNEPYYKHPREKKYTEMGEEVYFVRSCKGNLLKL